MDAADIETDEPPGTSAAGTGQPGPIGVPSRSAPADIDILDRSGQVAPAAMRWLVNYARAAVAHLNAQGEVRVAVLNDADMAAAHERYSNVPGATDVLTFDLRSSPAPEQPLDVDILVCVDEARRQGAARGVPLEHELLLYVLHGVLHCLGEDDHDDGAFVRMHAREDAVLAAIGVGPIYSKPRSEGAP